MGWILGVITLVTALFLSYLKDRLIETSISIFLFYIFRFQFEKQWHASSTYMCFLITSIVLVVIINIEVPLSTSILFAIIITFILTYISYYVKDYYEMKLKITKIKKYEQKDIYNLSLEELLKLFPNIKDRKIKIVYGYLHRDNKITAYEYAENWDISEPLLYKYVKEVKDLYKGLTKIS